MKPKNSHVPGTISLIVNTHKASFFLLGCTNQKSMTLNEDHLNVKRLKFFVSIQLLLPIIMEIENDPIAKETGRGGTKTQEEPCFQSNENPYGLGGSNFFVGFPPKIWRLPSQNHQT